MSYDDWKTSPPEDDDSDDLVCQNRQCKWTGPEDELARDEFGDRHCPECGSDDELITKAEEYRRGYDEAMQQKLDERRGK